MKPCIYMVDDEPDFLTIIHSWLEPAYDVVALKDGFELIGALRARAPDLVILDLNLPGLNGFEVCRQLRTTPGLQAVPVLFLTASTESRDYCTNLTSGASGYLTKPVGRRALLTAIDDLLSEHRIKQTADSGGSD